MAVENEKQIHILLVDDDVNILRLFSGWLAQAGFEVLPAHDGNECREMARRFQPDLVLLDIHLPVMNGYTTLGYLKRDKETAHIPVAFLSNEDLSIEAEQAWKEMGAEDYIPKSVPRETMLVRIEEILKRHGRQMPSGRSKEVI